MSKRTYLSSDDDSDFDFEDNKEVEEGEKRGDIKKTKFELSSDWDDVPDVDSPDYETSQIEQNSVQSPYLSDCDSIAEITSQDYVHEEDEDKPLVPLPFFYSERSSCWLTSILYLFSSFRFFDELVIENDDNPFSRFCSLLYGRLEITKDFFSDVFAEMRELLKIPQGNMLSPLNALIGNNVGGKGIFYLKCFDCITDKISILSVRGNNSFYDSLYIASLTKDGLFPREDIYNQGVLLEIKAPFQNPAMVGYEIQEKQFLNVSEKGMETPYKLAAVIVSNQTNQYSAGHFNIYIRIENKNFVYIETTGDNHKSRAEYMITFKAMQKELTEGSINYENGSYYPVLAFYIREELEYDFLHQNLNNKKNYIELVDSSIRDLQKYDKKFLSDSDLDDEDFFSSKEIIQVSENKDTIKEKNDNDDDINNWKNIFRNTNINQNQRKKNNDKEKRKENDKNQRYISKSSGLLYDYDINTIEGMEQRKRYLVDNEDYDTEEAEEAVEKEKNDDEEMIAQVEKMHLAVNPISDDLFKQSLKDILESVISIIKMLLTNFVNIENLSQNEIEEENQKLTNLVHEAYEKKWITFSDKSIISDVIIDDTEITWDAENRYKRCLYKKLIKWENFKGNNFLIFVDKTTTPAKIYKLNHRNKLIEVDGNLNELRGQDFVTYDDHLTEKKYILIEGDGLQQNDEGNISNERKTVSQKRLFEITRKKWTEQQAEKRDEFLEIILEDIDLINNYKEILEENEERGNTKEFWEIVYFYMIIGCMNGYANIFNLRPWQILFLYKTRIYKRGKRNEMLPSNLIELSTGSGKTFAGIFMMLFSLNNTDESGPKFFPQYKQHVIWATHNKTLVTQFSKEILPVLETPQFGYLYARSIGRIPKNIKTTSLFRTGMGEMKLALGRAILGISTYEHASIFLLDNIYNKPRKNSAEFYFDTLKIFIVDEIHSIAWVDRGRKIDDCLRIAFNYGVPIFAMSGTVLPAIRERLEEVYDIRRDNEVFDSGRTYNTEIFHIYSSDDKKEETTKKIQSEKSIPLFDRRFLASLFARFSIFFNPSQPKRKVIVFFNKIETLEYMYGVFMGMLTNFQGISEKLADIHFRKNNYNAYNFSPVNPDIIVNGFKYGTQMYGVIFNDQDIITADDILFLGLSCGVMLVYAKIFTQENRTEREMLLKQIGKEYSKNENWDFPFQENDLTLSPCRVVFGTSIFSTGFNIKDADTLFIHYNSIYNMSDEDLWQLYGRVGRYHDSKIYLFTVIDTNGSILRRREDPHTAFIVPNQYLIERLASSYSAQTNMTENAREALSKKDSHLAGCDATFSGFYSPAYELSLQNYEDESQTRLTDESFDFNHLGLLSPIFDISKNSIKMRGNIEAVYLFEVVFYSNHFLSDYEILLTRIISGKDEKSYSIYKEYIKTSKRINYKGFFIFPFVFYPFLVTNHIFNDSFSQKYDYLDVAIKDRWNGLDHENYQINRDEIFVIEASSELIKTMHQLYLSTFPESEPFDLFFSHFNYFLRVFLKGMLLNPEYLLNILNVSWLTIINPLMSYIDGCLKIGNKTSSGSLPELVSESLISVQSYMNEMINYIATNNKKWKGKDESMPVGGWILSAPQYRQIIFKSQNFFSEYCLNLGDPYYDKSRREMVPFLDYSLATYKIIKLLKIEKK